MIRYFILKEIYTNIYIKHNRNKKEMNNVSIAFLVHYMLYKRHGELRIELNVKNAF
jgi:hypothetical protein